MSKMLKTGGAAEISTGLGSGAVILGSTILLKLMFARKRRNCHPPCKKDFLKVHPCAYARRLSIGRCQPIKHLVDGRQSGRHLGGWQRRGMEKTAQVARHKRNQLNQVIEELNEDLESRWMERLFGFGRCLMVLPPMILKQGKW